jgi:hypothetical protein
MKHKLVELIIDCSTGQLSMSRLCLGLMNLAGIAGGLWLAWNGHGQWAAAMITGIAASDSAVYFASTRKNSDGCK